MGKRTASANEARETGRAVPQTIADLMTTKVVTADPETTLLEAIDLFVQHGFRHLLISDDQQRLAGVLSDRDALRHMARGNDPRTATVGDVMKREAIVVHPETRVTEAADLLRAHRINCLPVVDAGRRLLGIVTTTDLLATLRAVLGAMEHSAAS
jgi:acetoin utilization protein AcuB